MTFESLGLAPALVRALAESNYTRPTPIQAEAIPLALAGNDLLGGAQTGTGKTAAFGLPLLQRLAMEAAAKRPAQAARADPGADPRARGAGRTTASRPTASTAPERTVIYGGAGMQPQIDALRRGVDILVATPGRLIDHIERGTAELDEVEMLVLDEADRMLDMGFLPAIKRVLGRLPATRQTLLFSATFEAQHQGSWRWSSCATRTRCRSPRATPSPRPSPIARIRSTARASATC